ncbi:hypothetical protein Y032_0004g1889 [Ancylostoma ceylanicum]|nr:hypothetical protein Y032_0004g1889 [Ancylostoma ceylanicum]
MVFCVLPHLLSVAAPVRPRHGGENIPDCSLLGEKALGHGTRRHIVKRFARSNLAMRYDCNLEGFAFLELANHSYFKENLDIVTTTFERADADDFDIFGFIHNATSAWSASLNKMKSRTSYGCNYAKSIEGRYRLMCLYIRCWNGC